MATPHAPSGIRRKPVPGSIAIGIPESSNNSAASPNSTTKQREKAWDLVQSPISIATYKDTSSDSNLSDRDAEVDEEKLNNLHLSDRAATSSGLPADTANYPQSTSEGLDELEGNSIPPSIKTSKKFPLAAGHALKSAYGEVRHFAGGLITHPSESTKHYTILRHSHGIVYYSGSYTNLAITVFADRELPSDRTFWLQRKGFSGNTGMAVGVLFRTHGSWINVTPSMTATPAQVKPADERAWQRDIKKFHRKAPKKLARHRTRETNILRIPCDADDGYLRVVMCAGEKGKKHLCSSPVFRLASTSMSSSSIRGASLGTLPIEAAIKVGTFAARKTATTFAGPYVETARTFVTNQVTSVYQPGLAVQTAASAAIDGSGIPSRLDKMNEQYEQVAMTSTRSVENSVYDPMAQPVVLGDDAGPSPPYPVQFHGKVIPGTGTSTSTLGIPTANLTNVDADILLRYGGIYFGWASIDVPQKLRTELLIDDDWHEAIISIIPDPDSQLNVVQKKTIRIYIIEDFEDTKFFNCKLSIIMMGFIRPDPSLSSPLTPTHQPDLETALSAHYQDIACTTASLARPSWRPEETLSRIKSAASNRSFTERYIDIRQSTQKQIDRVPTWRLGVRSDGAAVKDKFIGNWGLRSRDDVLRRGLR